MKKTVKLFALFLIFVFHTSCGKNQTNASKDNIKSEIKDTVTSHGSNEKYIYSKYEYTDSNGKSLIIQNSFPKSGIKYTASDGKKYVYAVFWTRIINETVNPFELTIDFPLDSFVLPSSPGNYMKLLLPSDSITLDKETLYDYGLVVKSFLDNDIHKSSSLKKTIDPKESSGFYVVTLSNHGVNGTLRTELSLKGQHLFYRVNDKEIRCGRINLNLKSLK